MIRQVVLRRFKRFDEVVFDIPGHVVLAGPNNTGKTTLLQAIAAWSFALDHWRKLNDFKRRNGYTWAPIARQAFAAVPLRRFDLLWHRRYYRRDGETIEIEVRLATGEIVGVELRPDSTEQIYLRPSRLTPVDLLRAGTPSAVYVPPMTGLSIDEPVYQPPKIAQLLGMSKPGDVLRNLLVEANNDQSAWEALQGSIGELFGYELLPPDASGADIVADYRQRPDGEALDIASAGSGFQQVLMLLTFLNTREGSVLLLDEPDAHLHVILQDAIYGALRRAAIQRGSQLIVATHSEVIIDSEEPRELCVLMDRPRMLSTDRERSDLIRSLSMLSNTDIMLALDAPGVLYAEGHTDIAILKEWARILAHPALEILTLSLFWKPAVWENRQGGKGVKAADHYAAVSLVRADLPGLVLLDGDDRPEIRETPLTGQGLQRVRWRRYEIESYLVHPDALARFVTGQVGDAAAPEHIADLQQYLSDNFPPAVLREPLGDHAFLESTKARTRLLPPALDAAGLPGLPYTRYSEIAAVMLPEEIHPEVREKLDAICRAFGIETAASVSPDHTHRPHIRRRRTPPDEPIP